MLSKTTDYALRAVACLAGGPEASVIKPVLSVMDVNGEGLRSHDPKNAADGVTVAALNQRPSKTALQSMSADVLADRTKVPRRYLHRVLQDLIAANILSSRSGPGGGYILARAASELTILDVINAVSPFERILSCPLGLVSHTSLCPLHAELDRVYEATELAFRGVTIQYLIDTNASVAALCAVDA